MHELLQAVYHTLQSHGAAACGVCPRRALEPCMTQRQREQLEEKMPGWRAVFCAAFPFYVNLPAPPHAISRYAWGMDYHRVLAARLSPAAKLLTESGAHAETLVDASPVPERTAALSAGVGMLGCHGLVIVPPYGSYVFLGTIVTDSCAFDTVSPATILHCPGCSACRAACPSGALTGESFQMERCLSFISQKKGDLTDWERELLKNNHCLWGCDVCQEACPFTRSPRETTIPEFREALITAVTSEMLDDLTNREFQRRYGGRAFAWRGAGVLRRNLDISECRSQEGIP